ncbi:MAG: hypothetical protein JRF08_07265 [Deltaproteobacteria bacterium]|nr:hypothetical protein [Deltaproteobacteria bacterium]
MKVKISELNSDDAYDLKGLIPKENLIAFRKAGYLSIVVGDILDRLVWRIRPYEKVEGMADTFINEAVVRMAESFARHSSEKDLSPITDDLIEVVKEGKDIIDPRVPKDIIDPRVPRKPLIGAIGEIYLRSHVKSNQDTIRILEKYGAEVVNASIGEWINYTTYDQVRLARIAIGLNLKRFKLKNASIGEWINYTTYDQVRLARIAIGLNLKRFKLKLFYQYMQQRKVYQMVRKYIDIAEDHKIGHLEKVLKKKNTFSFEVGTEACLSISSALELSHRGYNGIVNIFPFTCLPSNLTASITKPLMGKLNVPYIDVDYDGSFQPGREAALRTFMYQANQHFKIHGRP